MRAIARIEKRSAVGFTLIEVVLALGIMGLMLSVGWGALRNVSESRRLMSERQDLDLIGQSVMSRLVKEFQLVTRSASLIPPKNASGVKYGVNDSFLAEEGSGDVKASVTFLALEGGQYLPDGGGHSGIVQISYKIIPTPPEEGRPSDSLSLIRSEIPYLKPYSKAYDREMVFPVSHDLIAASFEFYDESSSKWSKIWDPASHPNGGVPALIHFTFSVRSKAGRVNSYSTTIAVAK